MSKISVFIDVLSWFKKIYIFLKKMFDNSFPPIYKVHLLRRLAFENKGFSLSKAPK